MTKKRFICMALVLIMCVALAACTTPTPAAPGGTAPGGTAPADDAPATPDRTFNIMLAMTPGGMPRTDSPDIQWAYTFKEQVEANSGGAITVEIFPSGQLGTAAETIQGVIAGNIEMTIVDVALVSNVFPYAQLFTAPGVFASVEEFDAFALSPRGMQFREDLRATTGIQMLDMVCKGFRNFTTSNRELRVPEDARGVTFRTQESPIMIRMVEALGARAVPMPGSEMYVAMQQGVVDGQENPVLNIIQDLTYEVQTYLVLNGHVAGSMVFLINGRLYDEMGPELQAVVNEASAVAVAAAQEVIERRNREGVQILRDYGMTVYEPTVEELAMWREAVYGPTQEFLRETLGGDVVEEFSAALNTFRG